jgi:hypothetical protein
MANLPGNNTYNSPSNPVPDLAQRLSGLKLTADPGRGAKPRATYHDPLEQSQPPVAQANKPLEQGIAGVTPFTGSSDTFKSQPGSRNYELFNNTGTPTSPAVSFSNTTVQNHPDQPYQTSYYVDQAAPDRLIKTAARDEAGQTARRDFFLQGRDPALYQVDHITPLWAGGEDATRNTQVLTNPRHDQKTRAQAVALTLMNDINPATNRPYLSLKEARSIADTWEYRDLTDLPPLQDDTPGRAGLIDTASALAIKKRWDAQAALGKPKTYTEMLDQVPVIGHVTAEAAKSLGNAIDTFTPNAVKAFGKGALSGATFGWYGNNPSQEKTTVDTLAGVAGNIVGTIAPISAIFKTLGMGRMALGMGSTASRALAGEAGLELSAAAPEVQIARAATKTDPAIIQTLSQTKFPGVKVASLNMGQGTAAKEVVKTAAQWGAASSIYGALTPQGFAGDIAGVPETEPVNQFFKDFAFGTVGGVPGHSMALSAKIGAATTLMSYAYDPENPSESIYNGLLAGALQYTGGKIGSGASARHAELEAKHIDDAATVAANNILSPWLGDSFQKIDGYRPNVDVSLSQEAADKLWSEQILPKFQYYLKQGLSSDAERGVLLSDKVVSGGPQSVLNKSTIDKVIDSNLRANPQVTPSRFSNLLNRVKGKAEPVANIDAVKEDLKSKIQVPGGAESVVTNVANAESLVKELVQVQLALRQLVKRGLPAELRGQADLDDLLSFNNRANRMRDAGNITSVPTELTQWVASAKEDLFPSKYKTAAEHNQQVTSIDGAATPTGKARVTGVSKDKNSQHAAMSTFLDLFAAGKTSKKIALVPDTGMEPFLKIMGQENPGKMLRVFGFAQDEAGNTIIYPLGTAASEGRIQGGKDSFNNSPQVKDGTFEPLDPSLHNGAIHDAMIQNNTPVLLADISNAGYTIQGKGGKPNTDFPFLEYNMTPQNWDVSRLSKAYWPDIAEMPIDKVYALAAHSPYPEVAAAAQERMYADEPRPAVAVIENTPLAKSNPAPVAVLKEASDVLTRGATKKRLRNGLIEFTPSEALKAKTEVGNATQGDLLMELEAQNTQGPAAVAVQEIHTLVESPMAKETVIGNKPFGKDLLKARIKPSIKKQAVPLVEQAPPVAQNLPPTDVVTTPEVQTPSKLAVGLSSAAKREGITPRKAPTLATVFPKTENKYSKMNFSPATKTLKPDLLSGADKMITSNFDPEAFKTPNSGRKVFMDNAQAAKDREHFFSGNEEQKYRDQRVNQDFGAQDQAAAAQKETNDAGGYFAADPKSKDMQGGISAVNMLETINNRLDELVGMPNSAKEIADLKRKKAALFDKETNTVKKQYQNQDMTTLNFNPKKFTPRDWIKKTDAATQKNVSIKKQKEGYDTLKNLLSSDIAFEKGTPDHEYVTSFRRALNTMLKSQFGDNYSKSPELMRSVSDAMDLYNENYRKQGIGMGEHSKQFAAATGIGDGADAALANRTQELDAAKAEKSLNDMSDNGNAGADVGGRVKTAEEESNQIYGAVNSDLHIFPGLMVPETVELPNGSTLTDLKTTLGVNDAEKFFRKIQKANNDRVSKIIKLKPENRKLLSEGRVNVGLIPYKKGRTKSEMINELRPRINNLTSLLKTKYEADKTLELSGIQRKLKGAVDKALSRVDPTVRFSDPKNVTRRIMRALNGALEEIQSKSAKSSSESSR